MSKLALLLLNWRYVR